MEKVRPTWTPLSLGNWICKVRLGFQGPVGEARKLNLWVCFIGEPEIVCLKFKQIRKFLTLFPSQAAKVQWQKWRYYRQLVPPQPLALLGPHKEGGDIIFRIPSNKKLLDGIVSSNKELDYGTVPSNSLIPYLFTIYHKVKKEKSFWTLHFWLRNFLSKRDTYSSIRNLLQNIDLL